MEIYKGKENFLWDITIAVTEGWNAVDLTEYDWVDFVMTNEKTNINKVNDTAEFVLPKTSWILKYKLKSEDVDTVWKFKAYFALLSWWEKKIAVPVEYFQVIVTDSLL